MSGLLKGWLDGEDWPTTLKYANACGAFAVSRHGCTPAYPSWEELQFFFARGIVRKDLRNDTELGQVHWATGRRCGSLPSITERSSRKLRAPRLIGSVRSSSFASRPRSRCKTVGTDTVSFATAGWAPTRSAQQRDEVSGSADRWNGPALGRSRSSPR
jgi:hypothetical protein